MAEPTGFKKFLTDLDNNKNVTIGLTVFLAIYSAVLVPMLPTHVLRIFDNSLFKLLVLLVIAYTAMKNPVVAILGGIALIASMFTLYTRKKTKPVQVPLRDTNYESDDYEIDDYESGDYKVGDYNDTPLVDAPGIGGMKTMSAEDGTVMEVGPRDDSNTLMGVPEKITDVQGGVMDGTTTASIGSMMPLDYEEGGYEEGDYVEGDYSTPTTGLGDRTMTPLSASPEGPIGSTGMLGYDTPRPHGEGQGMTVESTNTDSCPGMTGFKSAGWPQYSSMDAGFYETRKAKKPVQGYNITDQQFKYSGVN